MTNTMTELQSVLERLSKKLDDKDNEDKEKTGFMPDINDMDGDGDKKEPMPPKKKKSSPMPMDDDDDEDEDMMYSDDDEDKKNKEDDEKMSKANDMITSDYLVWLESTVKSAGFDPNAARDHFNKGYGPGESAYDMRGQGSLEGAGEDDSGKRPQQNFGSAPTGNKTVIKGDYLAPHNVSPSEIESAYEVFKAAATEQNFKSDLNSHFTERFIKEQKADADSIAKSNFDSRAPLVELQKAVLALNDRIDNVSSTGGSMISKSASTATVTIPETAEMANMSWNDVHRLADKALTGGDY
jgi:hypothetical protein